MKLSLIVSVIALALVGCAAQPAPIQHPVVVTVRQLPPPPAKGEVVEEYLVVMETEIPDTREETFNPSDYERLSSLIHRETAAIKCVCVNGDPHCRCPLPNGPKVLPQE